MSALLLLIASSSVAIGSARLARACFPRDRPARLLAALLLIPAVVVAITLLVGGAFGAYRPGPLTAASLLAGLGLLLLARRAHRWGAHADLGPPGGGDAATALGHRSIERLGIAALALVVVGALAWRLLLALALPTNAFDALAYHLPAIAEWVRSGQVGPTAVTRALCCPWYPSSGEAWAGWTAPFLHGSQLIGLGQLWFAVVLALAAAMLARDWGASAPFSSLAGLLAGGMPIVLAQADTAYVDLTFAGALLAAYAFAVRAARAAEERGSGTDEWRNAAAPALLAGVAIGVAMGTKGTGLVAGPICALVLILLLARRLGRRSLRPLAAAAACALALGTPWYITAWVQTGNPITPYELELGGTTVFEGTQSYRQLTPPPQQLATLREPLRTVRSWAEDLRVATGGFKYSTDQRAGGFGPAFLLLGLPGLLWLVVARRRRDDTVLVVFGVLVLLLVQPYAWWSRFTIVVGALGMVAGARLLQRLPSAVRVACIVALVPLVAIPAAKVGAGDSAIVARYSRGELLRSAPGWIRSRPTTASLLPRFRPLDDAPGPVLVDHRVANRTVGVIVESDLRRRAFVARLTPELLVDEVERTGARTVVLPRAENWPRAQVERIGRIHARTDELLFLRVRR